MKKDDRVRALSAKILEVQGEHCTVKDRMIASLQAAATHAKEVGISHSKFLSYAEIVFTILGTPTEDELLGLAIDNTALEPVLERTRAYTTAEVNEINREGLKPPRRS